VISDLRIADAPLEGQVRAPAASVDALLVFDVLAAAAPATLAASDPHRTVAVVSTAAVPTAQMVVDPATPLPSARLPLRRIESATREALLLDAEGLAERLFADHMPANMLLVGAAFQHGCLPLSAAAIEQAIELNGAAVETNLAAFRWGRAWVVDRDAVEAALAPPAAAVPEPDARADAIIESVEAGGELRRLLEVRVPELIAYQDVAYARRYADDVARVLQAAGAPIAEAYARGLFKLMAYKDEYEVARLHLDAAERARREAAFGADAKVRVLLHPPLLRALGLKRKLRLGPWVLPLLRTLRAMRRLRGTPLDPFGRAKVRRVERELIEEYRALIDAALTQLGATNAELIVELADLPDVIRGYEEIRLRNVERFRDRAQELSGAIASQPDAAVAGLSR